MRPNCLSSRLLPCGNEIAFLIVCVFQSFCRRGGGGGGGSMWPLPMIHWISLQGPILPLPLVVTSGTQDQSLFKLVRLRTSPPMLTSVADTVRRYASFWNTFLFSFMSITLYSFCRPQRSWGQGNVFTPVCHSVHRGRGCLPQCMLGYTPPWADTLPWVDTPQADAPSLGRHPPHWADTPLWVDTPSQTDTPSQADTSPTSRRLLQRTIRVLLECILVFASFCVISFLFVFLIFGTLSWFCSNVLFSFSIIFSIWIKFNPLGPLWLPSPSSPSRLQCKLSHHSV